MGFAEWLRPVIDVILAPFKAVGNVVGGITGAVKGWFGETAGMGKAALEGSAANKKAVAGAQAAGTAQTVEIKPEFDMSNYKPGSEAVKTPAAVTTGAASGGGSGLPAERLAAASRKGISGAVSPAAPDAFMGAGTAALEARGMSRETRSLFPAASRAVQTASMQSPVSAVVSVDLPALERETRSVFPEAASRTQTAPLQTPRPSPEAKNGKRERPRFTVQNLTLHRDDMKNMFDFYETLETALLKPEEAAV
jgi:hypothetical protein